MSSIKRVDIEGQALNKKIEKVNNNFDHSIKPLKEKSSLPKDSNVQDNKVLDKKGVAVKKEVIDEERKAKFARVAKIVKSILSITVYLVPVFRFASFFLCFSFPMLKIVHTIIVAVISLVNITCAIILFKTEGFNGNLLCSLLCDIFASMISLALPSLVSSVIPDLNKSLGFILLIPLSLLNVGELFCSAGSIACFNDYCDEKRQLKIQPEIRQLDIPEGIAKMPTRINDI